MSIFSAIGKGLKAIGKGALTVGKTALSVANNAVASYTGISLLPQPSQASATSAAPQYTGPVGGFATTVPGYSGTAQISTAGSQVPIAQQTRSIGDILKELPGVVDVLSGNKAVQVEASAPSALPSWLLPVGVIGALGIAFLSVTGKGRR
jgi:hypothetical protein